VPNGGGGVPGGGGVSGGGGVPKGALPNGFTPTWSRRTLLAKTDLALACLLNELDQTAEECRRAQQAGGGAAMDEAKFQVSPWLFSRWATRDTFVS